MFSILGVCLVLLLGFSFLSTSKIIGFAVQEQTECVLADNYFEEQKEFYECIVGGDEEFCVNGVDEMKVTFVKHEFKKWDFYIGGVRDVYRYDFTKLNCEKIGG